MQLECYTAEAKSWLFMHGLSSLDARFSLSREDDMEEKGFDHTRKILLELFIIQKCIVKDCHSVRISQVFPYIYIARIKP